MSRFGTVLEPPPSFAFASPPQANLFPDPVTTPSGSKNDSSAERFFAHTMKCASPSLMKVQCPPELRRRGRIAKLPKMNNSERGKYYRNKNKQHELELEHSVAKLRKQVHDLELFMRVRDELYFRNPYDSCESIAGGIYEYFVRARDGQALPRQSPTPSYAWSSDSPASSISSPSCAPVTTTTAFRWEDAVDTNTTAVQFFDLLSCHVEGGVDAPVVVMRGMLHTKYSLSTINRVFPHLRHYQDLLDELLDKEVQYPCTYRFFFGAGGTFENKVVEADYVHGLQQVVGSLADVVWLLDGSGKCTERRESLDDIIRGPPTMSLGFILS